MVVEELAGSFGNYFSNIALYVFFPQCCLYILTHLYNRCRGRTRLTPEEKKASQRQIIIFVGVPIFVYWVYSSIIDSKETNYYDILRVGYDFETSDIKKQFYRMSREAHPDKGGSEDAFIYLQTAYEALKNEETRIFYNKFGPEYKDCSHCRNIDDYYSEITVPSQVQFALGCVVVLWFFGGGSLPRLPFGLLLIFVLCVQVFLIYGDDSICFGLQMLPFEVINALYILWGTLLSAQFMFSNVWGSDTRSERDLLLQVEQSTLSVLGQIHNLICLHDVNLQDPKIRTEVVELLKTRDEAFKLLRGDAAANMEDYMLPDKFEFSLKKIRDKWKLINESQTEDEKAPEEEDEEPKKTK